MTYTLLTALLVVAAPVPMREDAVPTGRPPTIRTVTVSAEGNLCFAFTVLHNVPVTTIVEVQVGNRVEKVAKTSTRTEFKRILTPLNSKDTQVFGIDGKKVEWDDFRRLVKSPLPVLVSSDGEPVDPFYLRLARPGTLVLVMPVVVPQPQPKGPTE